MRDLLKITFRSISSPYTPAFPKQSTHQEEFSMARIRYSPARRAKIVKAVAAARAAGKKGDEVHKAAQTAGYKGGRTNLFVFLRAKGGAKRRGRKATGKRKVGRPAKSSNHLGPLQAVIDGLVQKRVKTVIAGLRKALAKAFKKT